MKAFAADAPSLTRRAVFGLVPALTLAGRGPAPPARRDPFPAVAWPAPASDPVAELALAVGAARAALAATRAVVARMQTEPGLRRGLTITEAEAAFKDCALVAGFESRLADLVARLDEALADRPGVAVDIDGETYGDPDGDPMKAVQVSCLTPL